MSMTMGRRTFLAGASAAVAAGTPAQAQHTVPNSDGSEAPKLKAPANACDCHMHIYDGDRFPPARPGPQSRMQSNAAVDQYKLLQARIGTTRTVIVTPAAYVTDNRVTTDAIQRLGAGQHARRRGGASDRHRRRASRDGRRRHPRHPLHGVRSGERRGVDRHDRAAGQARRRSRLACADPHARRPDRRECRSAAAPADAGRVRSHGAVAAAGAARSSRPTRSSARCSTRAAPG